MLRLLLLILLAFTSSSAAAHQFEHPKTLRVGIERDRLLISFLYDLNPGRESREARTLFDRNSDQVLDDAERQRIESWMTRTALLWFKVYVDGKDQTASLKLIESKPHQLGRSTDSNKNLGISLLLSLPLNPEIPEVQIRLADRDKDAKKHVPTQVDVAGGYEVALASQGQWHPKTRQLDRIGLRKGHDLHLRLIRAGP